MKSFCVNMVVTHRAVRSANQLLLYIHVHGPMLKRFIPSPYTFYFSLSSSSSFTTSLPRYHLSLVDQSTGKTTVHFRLKDVSYCAKHPENHKSVELTHTHVCVCVCVYACVCVCVCVCVRVCVLGKEYLLTY